MRNRNAKLEFFSLGIFLVAGGLLLTNGFVARISAANAEEDVYKKIEPVGLVLSTIMREYVRDADLDKLVEGAITGMMESLDRHSSYITQEDLEAMREETKGEFEGIGVQIKMNEDERIMVFTPINGSPAHEAGIRPFDLIAGIDGVSTEGMTLGDAADLIRGPKGTTVTLTIEREVENNKSVQLDIDVKRGKVPLESIKESRLLDGGVAYIRISDFKDTTARDLRDDLKEYLAQGARGIVLDLRWNPGGLLTASQQVCQLFLPKNSLVTYTKSRPLADGRDNPQDIELHTKAKPVVPLELPLIVLVNEQTASSSEIVTGALQFHQRAIVVGEKTFGKGSVQTIIPVPPRKETALRLTTALYYTPADVTIDHQGILPDVEVAMAPEEEQLLGLQMYRSYEDDPAKINQQNHGSVTGNEVTQEGAETEEERQLLTKVEERYGEETAEALRFAIMRSQEVDRTIEDVQLRKAVDMLDEGLVWNELLAKYHRDVSETQTAAAEEEVDALPDGERLLLDEESPEPVPSP